MGWTWEIRLLIITVFTRLAINAALFYWVVLGNICVSTVSLLLACTLHTCSSFSLINTDAGTPHSRHCQIVLPSFGNSSLAIQSFMSLNIISSVVWHLVFKSVANTCFLCSGWCLWPTPTCPPLTSGPNRISLTGLHNVEVEIPPTCNLLTPEASLLQLSFKFKNH